MIIDTHAHLNFPAFDKDRKKVIQKCLDNNIWMINAGTNFKTSQKAVEIAQEYKQGVYAAVGLHPMSLDTGLIKLRIDDQEGEGFEKEFDYLKYRDLAQSQNVVAIGEIGLDYYWKPKTKKRKELFKQKQKDLFLKQLELVKELDLPVIIHSRMAHNDLIDIVSGKDIKAVAHGFVGNTAQLRQYLELGFFIGFNGIIFKSIEGINFEENIKITPLDRILVETDCPYLTPPQREGARNEPLFVKYVIRKIAELKNMNYTEAKDAIAENAKNFFSL